MLLQRLATWCNRREQARYRRRGTRARMRSIYTTRMYVRSSAELSLLCVCVSVHYGGPLVQFSRFAPRPISSSSFRLFSPASSLLPLSPPAFLKTFSPSFFHFLPQLFSLSPPAFFTLSPSFFSLSPPAFFTLSPSFFHSLPQLFFTFSPSFFHFLPQLFSLSPPAFFHFLPQLFVSSALQGSPVHNLDKLRACAIFRGERTRDCSRGSDVEESPYGTGESVLTRGQ